jgi:hypothetical protein
MTPRFSIPAALGLLLLAQTMNAQEQPEATPDAPSADARVAGEEGGLVSLLEFLGEFTTEDGEWVDPELLVETETEDAESSADPTENCSDPQCE